MSAPVHWSQIPPAAATKLVLPDPDIIGPRNEYGEHCPWPWEPQQLVDVPLGMYHCPYCGAVVMASAHHPDYTELLEVLEDMREHDRAVLEARQWRKPT